MDSIRVNDHNFPIQYLRTVLLKNVLHKPTMIEFKLRTEKSLLLDFADEDSRRRRLESLDRIDVKFSEDEFPSELVGKLRLAQS
jgi:hypothetical protein